MSDSENHGENRHAGDGNGLEEMVGVDDDVPNPTAFDVMEEEEAIGVCDREIWLERQHEDLLDVNDSSIFCNDFPPLLDFPCMSCSSSSSCTPAPAKSVASSSSSYSSASSSSSVASWAVLKSDAEEDVEKRNHHNQHDQEDAPLAALSSTASMEALPPPPDDSIGDVDCMDVMEDFGYMDLVDSNGIWDPSSIFQNENPQESQQIHQPQEHHEQYMLQGNGHDDDDGVKEQRPLDELGIVFFEWLKSNKESISAEDMRSIKLRRATIDCASERLGSTKEGRKQLLKLILEWVEQYQLQKKRLGEAAPQFPCHYQEPFQNPNPNLSSCNPIPPPDMNTCFLPPPWMPPPPPPYVTDPSAVAVAPPAFPPLAARYPCDPYSRGVPVPPLNQNVNFDHSNYPASTEYHLLNSAHTWPPSPYAKASQYKPFPENNNNINIPTAMPRHPPQSNAGYENQYPYQCCYQGNGEKLVRLGSSATKEARKKRMARQRRFLFHHRHHSHQNPHQNQNADQQARFGDENCTNSGQANPANWVYWPTAAAAPPASSTVPPMMPADAPQPQTEDRPPVQAQQWQVSSDRRQGWKSEKNLKFLLQKVLKQSDVGNLGRIVLPKKEAETHLPELEARDGIPIAMEDIGTSRVWHMRYRFWPNNKSRMYLLENTGDFVRVNGLQEGDFIVIYSDVKCRKYLIRGVKVRQQGPKPEAKKPSKTHKNPRIATSPAAGNGGVSSQPSQKE